MAIFGVHSPQADATNRAMLLGSFEPSEVLRAVLLTRFMGGVA